MFDPGGGKNTAGLHLCGAAGSINIINVHIEPALDDSVKQQQLGQVLATISKDHTSFIFGDFNLVDEQEGRFHPRSGTWTRSDAPMGKWLSRQMGGITEIIQDDFTHQQVAHDDIATLSRIDRSSTDMPELDLLDSKLVAGVWGRLEAPLQHAPRRRTIPEWVCKHPTFKELFYSLYMESVEYFPSISRSEIVSIIKHCAHEAARATKEHAKQIGAKTEESRPIGFRSG